MTWRSISYADAASLWSQNGSSHSVKHWQRTLVQAHRHRQYALAFGWCWWDTAIFSILHLIDADEYSYPVHKLLADADRTHEGLSCTYADNDGFDQPVHRFVAGADTYSQPVYCFVNAADICDQPVYSLGAGADTSNPSMMLMVLIQKASLSIIHRPRHTVKPSTTTMA